VDLGHKSAVARRLALPQVRVFLELIRFLHLRSCTHGADASRSRHLVNTKLFFLLGSILQDNAAGCVDSPGADQGADDLHRRYGLIKQVQMEK
jgi:hypothetical protein